MNRLARAVRIARAAPIARAARAVRGTLVAVLLAVAGCDVPHEEIEIPEEILSRPASPAVSVPDAFLIRFQDVRGTGFSRESWELEVLQMGGDVRVRGTLRTGGRSVPVYRPMDHDEFAQFWDWVRQFPLDGFRVQEDPSAPDAEWRKRLKFDAVLGPDQRWLCENEWNRAPLEAPWLAAIEDRLHLMLIELAESELDREEALPAEDPAVTGVQRAMEALGDAEATNLPGGSPDVD
ncbi:MAG: hypothetical protein HKN12_01760 [Gemmatimonadetes bacterium]|nr:hypothetical protein [Gemmatimonadota bacterium]